MQLRSAARARAAFSVWVFSHVPQVGVDLCVGFFAHFSLFSPPPLCLLKHHLSASPPPPPVICAIPMHCPKYFNATEYFGSLIRCSNNERGLGEMGGRCPAPIPTSNRPRPRAGALCGGVASIQAHYHFLLPTHHRPPQRALNALDLARRSTSAARSRLSFYFLQGLCLGV